MKLKSIDFRYSPLCAISTDRFNEFKFLMAIQHTPDNWNSQGESKSAAARGGPSKVDTLHKLKVIVSLKRGILAIHLYILLLMNVTLFICKSQF